MKKAILIVCMSFFAVNAQAGFWDIVGAVAGAIGDSSSSGSSSSRPDSYDSRHRSRVSCSYTDDGHEEHSRGHRDCNECLNKHGHCKETCSTDYAVCKVEGRDYRGYSMTVEAKADSQYDAERDALRRCDRNNLTDCRRVSCSNESETVSRRTCRR
jgi:hypothetical protein